MVVKKEEEEQHVWWWYDLLDVYNTTIYVDTTQQYTRGVGSHASGKGAACMAA